MRFVMFENDEMIFDCWRAQENLVPAALLEGYGLRFH